MEVRGEWDGMEGERREGRITRVVFVGGCLGTSSSLFLVTPSPGQSFHVLAQKPSFTINTVLCL